MSISVPAGMTLAERHGAGGRRAVLRDHGEQPLQDGFEGGVGHDRRDVRHVGGHLGQSLDLDDLEVAFVGLPVLPFGGQVVEGVVGERVGVRLDRHLDEILSHCRPPA
jgi:hypothetical protein